MRHRQTHYGDWLATQERGEQKRGNVERLLQLTRRSTPTMEKASIVF